MPDKAGKAGKAGKTSKAKRDAPTQVPVDLGSVRYAIKVYTAEQIDEMLADLPSQELIEQHIADKDNPHEVTGQQVGVLSDSGGFADGLVDAAPSSASVNPVQNKVLFPKMQVLDFSNLEVVDDEVEGMPDDLPEGTDFWYNPDDNEIYIAGIWMFDPPGVNVVLPAFVRVNGSGYLSSLRIMEVDLVRPNGVSLRSSYPDNSIIVTLDPDFDTRDGRPDSDEDYVKSKVSLIPDAWIRSPYDKGEEDWIDASEPIPLELVDCDSRTRSSAFLLTHLDSRIVVAPVFDAMGIGAPFAVFTLRDLLPAVKMYSGSGEPWDQSRYSSYYEARFVKTGMYASDVFSFEFDI